MPDPANQKPAVPNRRPRNKSACLTVNDHICGLPVLKQMSYSQQMLIKASSSWQDWRSRNLPPAISGQATLSHFDNGILVISCANAAIATQIKHLQGRLVEHFHQDGLQAITKIELRLQYTNDRRSTVNNHQLSGGQSLQNRSRRDSAAAASQSSLESIRQCRKSVTNDELSSALNRLEKTLRQG